MTRFAFRTPARRPYIGFAILFTAMLAVLSARLFHLQIARGDFYRGMSTRNHIRIISKPAPRGLIFDRNGEVLADNVPVFVVSIVPYEFDSADVQVVSDLLGMPADTLLARIGRGSSRPYRPQRVSRGLSVEEISPLAENLYRIGGVVVDVVPQRRYPCGPDFCHVIGYVGLSTESGSGEGTTTGRAGLELSLDGILSGTPGYRREVVDAVGRKVAEFGQEGGEADPVPGRAINLTIDAGLQRTAVAALSSENAPGAAVVLDYETGEILCLASTPVFDLQAMSDGMTRAAWDSLCSDPGRPFLSRAWGARYPPGSVFKLVTALYLLDNDLVTPSYMPDPCYGSYRLGGNDFGCWTAHGRVALVEAVAQSCDVYFYRTIQMGSLDGLAGFARLFGLGSPVLDFLPGESSGLVPDTRTLDSLYGEEGWGLGNLLNISIGQGELLVTPLQMAVVTGIIASEGRMPGITLVREVEPGQPPGSGLSLEPGDIETVVEGMKEAVYGRQGTLRALSSLPFEFFGKSGTAESPAGDHAWVVGFTREPRPLAIAVVVEHGGHGGAVAAPVVSRILVPFLEE